MVKTAYASKPWDYRENSGWERVGSPFNDFMNYKTMDGRGWFLHLMLLSLMHPNLDQ